MYTRASRKPPGVTSTRKMDCAGHSAAMRTKYIRGLEAMHSALDQIQSLQHKIRQLEHNEPTASKGLSSVSEGHIRILETSLSKAQSVRI